MDTQTNKFGYLHEIHAQSRSYKNDRLRGSQPENPQLDSLVKDLTDFFTVNLSEEQQHISQILITTTKYLAQLVIADSNNKLANQGQINPSGINVASLRQEIEPQQTNANKNVLMIQLQANQKDLLLANYHNQLTNSNMPHVKSGTNSGGDLSQAYVPLSSITNVQDQHPSLINDVPRLSFLTPENPLNQIGVDPTIAQNQKPSPIPSLNPSSVLNQRGSQESMNYSQGLNNRYTDPNKSLISEQKNFSKPYLERIENNIQTTQTYDTDALNLTGFLKPTIQLVNSGSHFNPDKPEK
jgi:hypothetical protein